MATPQPQRFQPSIYSYDPGPYGGWFDDFKRGASYLTSRATGSTAAEATVAAYEAEHGPLTEGKKKEAIATMEAEEYEDYGPPLPDDIPPSGVPEGEEDEGEEGTNWPLVIAGIAGAVAVGGGIWYWWRGR